MLNPKKIMLLHGNRQTGDLLSGRMGALRRKLRNTVAPNNKSPPSRFKDLLGNDSFEIVAPNAPHEYEIQGNESGYESDEVNKAIMRTWWIREGNGKDCVYCGLQESLELVHDIWMQNYNENMSNKGVGAFEGLFGFSQGAMLAYLITKLNSHSRGALFPNLRYVIFSGGYGDMPLPANFEQVMTSLIKRYKIVCDSRLTEDVPLSIPNLHVIGLKDRMIRPEQSHALATKFTNPFIYEFDGGHHVPMKTNDLMTYVSFIAKHTVSQEIKTCATNFVSENKPNTTKRADPLYTPPDDEHEMEQISEVEALEAIYPEEFCLLSNLTFDNEERLYKHPIEYTILLHDPQNDHDELWPPEKVALRVKYPSNYPDVVPTLSLFHTMNVMQFSSSAEAMCLSAINESAKSELGMPCVMTCVLAAKDFFEGGGLTSFEHGGLTQGLDVQNQIVKQESDEDARSILGLSADSERIKICDIEGQSIANQMLSQFGELALELSVLENEDTERLSQMSSFGGGGIWKYTIGLVGKPSAGKSTFFNAATGFARQHGDSDDGTFGASMAPHPFTTIDPNVGFCFVPAPFGSCPEDALDEQERRKIGSTHGRGPDGRRFVYATLKDVAGLVPGAYKGRGKGNKFLDDLTDADVLIHVMDASGTADTEGNEVGVEGGVHPIKDLAWVRKEVLEWISFNLEAKWDKVKRKGQQRLVDMFSGYKQSQSFVWNVLLQVEKFMANGDPKRLNRALDHLGEWDGGDLRRLVNAFLGVRFPMALAMNKIDLPSGTPYANEVDQSLPCHGAYTATPLSARSEMEFVRSRMTGKESGSIPIGVWSCLQSAMVLREPILVFPVSNMTTYESLPGLLNYATRHASLPSAGYIRCLEAAGGSAPTLWESEKSIYHSPDSGKLQPKFQQPLRDCILMKPGSTVEDVFTTLKGLGALKGDYVRAEAASNMGEKTHLVRKDDQINSKNRILKIMTNRKY